MADRKIHRAVSCNHVHGNVLQRSCEHSQNWSSRDVIVRITKFILHLSRASDTFQLARKYGDEVWTSVTVSVSTIRVCVIHRYLLTNACGCPEFSIVHPSLFLQLCSMS